MIILPRVIIIPILCILSLLLSACATTEITGFWQDESYTGGALKEMTVIGIFQDDFIRRKIEDDFVKEGSKYNFDIAASYLLIPLKELNSKEFIKKQVQASNADSLLITRVINKTIEETYVTGTTYYSPQDSYYDWHEYYARGYGRMRHPGYSSPMAYSPDMYDEPGQIIEREIYSLETNIYHVATNKLLMTIKTDTAKDASTDSVISNFAKTIIQKMLEKGLIAK